MPDPHAHRPHDFTSLVRTRIGALPVDPMREADIVDELAQHVAEHYAELAASGMPDAEALKQALAPLDERDCVAAEITRADRPRSVIARLKPSRYGPAPQPAGSANLLVDVARDVRYAARTPRSSAC